MDLHVCHTTNYTSVIYDKNSQFPWNSNIDISMHIIIIYF